MGNIKKFAIPKYLHDWTFVILTAMNKYIFFLFISEEYYEFEENINQVDTDLPSSLTIEILPPIKQESVIISTEVARNMLQESTEVEERYEKLEPEANTGVHFLTDEENLNNKSDESYEKKKSELLEYLIKQDGSVVCKLCGEVLASRTHWYRHKYKLHVNSLVNPAPLFKCIHCNVFFKSRKGYTGHISSRHGENQNQEVTDEVNVVVKEEIVETSYSIATPPHTITTNNTKKKIEKIADWEEQREKEAKLVADIIDRVRKECEAQGAPVGRRGYTRRSTSIMNTVA